MLKKQGVYAILGLVLVFAITHLAIPPDHHDPRTTGTVMLGGIAFLLMTSSIVLSTRLDVLEDWFGGLDRMYQVHRVAGVLDTSTHHQTHPTHTLFPYTTLFRSRKSVV